MKPNSELRKAEGGCLAQFSLNCTPVPAAAAEGRQGKLSPSSGCRLAPGEGLAPVTGPHSSLNNLFRRAARRLSLQTPAACLLSRRRAVFLKVEDHSAHARQKRPGSGTPPGERDVSKTPGKCGKCQARWKVLHVLLLLSHPPPTRRSHRL